MATLNASGTSFACRSPTTRPRLPATLTLNVALKVSSDSSHLRYKNTKIFRIRRTSLPVLASNPNSSGNDAAKEKADGSTNDAEGPPLLTILAGFFVFSIVLWLIYSLVSWLIGLIVNWSSSG